MFCFEPATLAPGILCVAAADRAATDQKVLANLLRLNHARAGAKATATKPAGTRARPAANAKA